MSEQPGKRRNSAQSAASALPEVAGARIDLGKTLPAWRAAELGASGPRLPPAAAEKPSRERRAQPGAPLFRERALQRQRQDASVAEILEVTPRLWAGVTLALSVLVIAAVVAAVVGQIDVVSTARGVMRPLDGVVAVASEVDGLVAQIFVSPGQQVVQGQTLLALDSAPMRARVLEAERRRDFAREQLEQLRTQRAGLGKRAHTLLSKQVELADARMESQRQQLARLSQREQQTSGLEQRGVLLKRDADEVRDRLGLAQRTLLELNSQQTDVRYQDNRLEREQLDLEREWQMRLREAETQLESAHLLLKQTLVRASLSGTVESLLVRVGEQLRPTSPIGRLIPLELSDRVVVFIPERDRAFVKLGSRVRVALDQLPVSEFGSMTGSVVRVSRAIATAAEISEVFGTQTELLGPRFKVEVALIDDAKHRQLGPRVRTGALVTGHITLRKQRLIALLLGPLRELFTP